MQFLCQKVYKNMFVAETSFIFIECECPEAYKKCDSSRDALHFLIEFLCPEVQTKLAYSWDVLHCSYNSDAKKCITKYDYSWDVLHLHRIGMPRSIWKSMLLAETPFIFSLNFYAQRYTPSLLIAETSSIAHTIPVPRSVYKSMFIAETSFIFIESECPHIKNMILS